ncbi:MAG TPA: ectonucleotide pyrophosphatase/phosphodiesterase [Pirellulaceae bacterium]|jgi:predicted AlkP superfamily pyrophosphatase or phosphodiesterase|nr:ectonucleotide pyrophosphatase/phosphodiesterase [Pirellulaceae bacterium]
MRLLRSRLALLLSVVLLVGGVGVSSLHAQAKDRHVVVVSIDGFAAFLLDDPKAPVPTLRRLAKQGSYAPEGMQVSNPSVTWPNHTSMVTGVHPIKHGVLANGVLVRGGPDQPVTVDPRRDQKELVHAPTVFDAADAAGLTTADVNWPCTRGSQTLDDSFSDVPEQVEHMTPRLREELIAKGILQDDTQKSFMANSIVGRDLVWTETACHIIRERKPNLTLIHLLNVDATHHAEGAQSQPGYTANAYADMCLARIVQAIDDAGIRDATTILVVADHGFAMTPKAICPNVLLRQEGLLTVAAGKMTDARVHVFPEGGVGLVYCTHPGDAEADRERAAKLFEGQEGVAAVVLPEDFAKYGMPHPREYAQAPDAILVAKDGYAVSGTVEGEAFVAGNVEAKTSLGSHGFVSDLAKMNALCVLSGAGIKEGARLTDVENIDVAATIAKLLHLPDFACDGKPLEEALLP